jgi:flagellin
MAMTINTNIASTSAQRHLNASRKDLDLAMERLSSGQRINSAKDDAAGLAIRDKMSSQIVGLNQSIRNANDAISLAQTAEGAMEESVSILQRMRVLAMQAVNDTNTDSDRANLNDEFTQLQLELTRIGITSSFNNVKLLDGTFSGSTFQVGPGASETIFLKISDQKANAIGTTYDVASFDIFAANSPAKGDSLSLTIRGADGDGGDLTVTYQTAKAETAIQTASGMVLALNSNPTFTQKYQALSDANNSILIRRTDGTSMGLPVRAQFEVAQAQVSDTVTVTVDGVATGGAAKDFTYTVADGKTSATDISTGVAKALNADENGFGRFYRAYASSYASTEVTLTVDTAIENNETAAITIDGTTFTTAKLSANATASDVGDAFAALSVTGWDISNNKGVVTFYKNADYSNTGETGQSVIATADAPTVTIGGSGSGGPSIKEKESIEFTAGAKTGDAITFTIGAQEHTWTATQDYATGVLAAAAAVADWNSQTTGLATGYTASQGNTAAVHTLVIGGDIDSTDTVTISDGTISFTHTFATTRANDATGRGLAAAELKAAIEANTDFNAAYTVSVLAATITLTEKVAGVSSRVLAASEPTNQAGTFTPANTTAGANANTATINFESDTAGTAGVFNMTTSVALQAAASGSVAGTTTAVETAQGAAAVAAVHEITIASAYSTSNILTISDGTNQIAYTATAADVNIAASAAGLMTAINGGTFLFTATLNAAGNKVVLTQDTAGHANKTVTEVSEVVSSGDATAVTIASIAETTVGTNAVAEQEGLAFTAGAKAGDKITLTFDSGTDADDHTYVFTAASDLADGAAVATAVQAAYASGTGAANSTGPTTFVASVSALDSTNILFTSDTAINTHAFTLTASYLATSSGTLVASSSSTNVTAGTDGSGSGAVTAVAVDKVADGKVEIRAKNGTTVDTSKIKVDQLIGANTESKIINEHTGFEVTVTSKTSTTGDLSVSKVVDAVDVFVNDIDVLSASAAMEAVRVVDDAVAMIGRERAGLGAFQNRLEHAMSNMANNSQNTQAARSVIADADYAKEAAALAKNQILQQAGTAMLAQANSQAETVLNLLK